jgi:hypothetical protein
MMNRWLSARDDPLPTSAYPKEDSLWGRGERDEGVRR